MKEKVESQAAENFSVLRFTTEGGASTTRAVARELPLTIILNDLELVTLLCSPNDLRYLAAGFLYSEGLINSREEIKRITVDEVRGVVRLDTADGRDIDKDVLFKRVISSGCGRGASFYSIADAAVRKIESRLEISVDQIFALVDKFQHGSRLYQETGGVHSAALCDRENLLVFMEDIGRHNAVDKLFGKCLLEGIVTDERIIVTSGRVSSEILHKIARRAIPVVISISAPTNLGVKTADTLGITLVASVRGKKMDVYTSKSRVVPACQGCLRQAVTPDSQS